MGQWAGAKLPSRLSIWDGKLRPFLREAHLSPPPDTRSLQLVTELLPEIATGANKWGSHQYSLHAGLGQNPGQATACKVLDSRSMSTVVSRLDKRHILLLLRKLALRCHKKVIKLHRSTCCFAVWERLHWTYVLGNWVSTEYMVKFREPFKWLSNSQSFSIYL